MSIKSDRWIRNMALEHQMIEPFVDQQVRSGVISYGLSSYGYDMRVTDEFKVFTNVFNVIVDPKNFNQRSFVDIKADYCDIPPNSFALARSVEYFRIPRNVSCIVMGKSTYARCFRGDTRVALVDGTSATLEDMATRAEKGETFWGYSIGRDGHLLVTRLEQPRYIGRDALLRIKLDNGKEITCTPDHQMMLCDGTMVMANELRAGTSLMPLYRNVSHGFEYVHQPLTGTYRPTHWLADEWNLRHNIYHDTPTTYRLHYDENHRNNRPENIMREHSRHHDVVATTTDQVMGQTTCLAIGQTIDQTIDEERVHVFATHHPTTTLNHKVVKVTELKGDHDVYCLTVPEAGNFALDAGVFVSNCGIIVNVTPLEPEWSGHVTIEISNTTPLPARIYANEGIGQVLFFEGDEPCERSYADKKGKYQSQEGIVLPRIDINS